MAFNPFLSMGDPVAPMQTDVSNPFMMDDVGSIEISADNPFSGSNPFADFGETTSDCSVSSSAPMDIFGFGVTSSTIVDVVENEKYVQYDSSQNVEIIKPTDLNLVTNLIDHKSAYSSEEELKPQRPPPPARPLPAETKTLILSVTDQMDITSSHLLDRIPLTRTPSPVSMRDLHSPTMGLDEDFIQDNDQTITETAMCRTQPEEINPFETKTELVDKASSKPERPMRPPPARPPPARPQPPAVVQPVQSEKPEIMPAQNTGSEEVNLFDAPVVISPPKPSNEQILSLYSRKEEKTPVDFLSDDLNAPDIAPEEIKTKSSDIQNDSSKSSSHNQSFASSRHNSIKENFTDYSTPIEATQIETKKETEIHDEVFFENAHHGHEEASNPFEFTQTAENIDAVDEMGQNEFRNDFPTSTDPFSSTFSAQKIETGNQNVVEVSAFPEQQDEFDAFSAKFDSTIGHTMASNAWGDSQPSAVAAPLSAGFETDSGFDAFLSMTEAPPAPTVTPARLDSPDSEEENFNIKIKPIHAGEYGEVPALAPPPKPTAFAEQTQINPFAGTNIFAPSYQEYPTGDDQSRKQSGSETPQTPLFDEDVSVPLEEFPRVIYDGPGWEMQLRHPNKKKITGQRYWKKVFVKLSNQGDTPVVQLYNASTDKEPFQELPLQACYSVSDIAAQQYDQYGKIFTVKLQYIFYKERPGVRPGQVTKAERITNKLSQFAAYAIQGDYQGVKEFGSDLKKLGLPVEHAPQISQLFKIGSLNYEDVKQFSVCIEEALFKIPVHRDRALQYKFEEVQITAVDELYVEQTHEGSVTKQIARVRLFFLGFLCGMPDVEVGVNDLRRQGKEVVGRHDIIPVVTEEWIRVENAEFHACVQSEEFLKTQILRFKPPDACYVELMRFRIRPPKNRELPLQLKAVMCVTGNKVELRADVLVPGFTSRKLGQIPCEDVMIRFPIPECWIYLFRVEKHFRYGSVKSAHRRTGKVKGLERLLGAVDTLQESLIEVTSGQAKYEHQHRAIVWRMSRLPKEGQGAYTTHNLVCRMALTSYDQIPEELTKYAYIEFTMPHTQVSHMTVRSVSLQNHDSDEPPEKYVRYLARHEYVVGIEHTKGSTTAAYVAAATVQKPPTAAPAAVPTPVVEQSSESDSD